MIIFTLILCSLATGCSKSGDEVGVKDIKQLESRILELEKENAQLKLSADVSVVSEPITTTESKSEKSDVKNISIGDTITTDRMELTIKKVELSYNVLPKDTSSFYTHYPADSGQVYIHIETDVKNIQKQNLNCDSIMEVEADYNDGYKYSSMTVPEDSSGFTYANITSIKPLETMGIRFLIDCPEEIEKSDEPLFLIFKFDNQEFKYSIR